MALSKSPNNVQLAAWLYSDEHEKGEERVEHWVRGYDSVFGGCNLDFLWGTIG